MKLDQLKSLEAGRVAAWLMEIPSGEIQFDPIKAIQIGYDPSEDRFKTYHGFTDLIHKDDYEPTMEAMRKLLDGRLPMYKCQYRIKAGDGTWHTYMDQGTIQSKADGITYVFGATVDITA